MGKLERSWGVFRNSMRVLNREKKLLVFPLISAVFMLALVVLIVSGITILTVAGAPVAETLEASKDGSGSGKVIVTAIFFVCYLVTMTVSVFCNVAFYAEIFRGLRGESVSLRRGFGFAVGRLKAIVLWSLLASTVGVILNALQERAGLLGTIVLKIIGVVWAVASCFAIPVLVADPALNNPVEALRRSGATIKKTWGESLIGFLGLRVLSGLAVVGFILWCVALGVLMVAAPLAFAVPALLFALGLVGLVVFLYLVSVSEQIYRAGLYLYAAGETVECFAEDQLRTAFKTKK